MDRFNEVSHHYNAVSWYRAYGIIALITHAVVFLMLFGF